MTDFERIQYFYVKGWAKRPQVAMYVTYGVITAEDYKTIIGETYVI